MSTQAQPRGSRVQVQAGLLQHLGPGLCEECDFSAFSICVPQGFGVSFGKLRRWKSRSKAVLTELKSFDADLMCIQELDEYDTFYKKNMENSGYSSIYIQRSGDKRDGCGIFYKPKSAELVQKESIHYNDLVGKYAPTDHVDNVSSNNSSPEEETNAKTDNNKHGDLNDPHLDPELIDVKLAQAKYLLSRVSQFERLVSNKFNCKPSVIIAGDFNSTPGDKLSILLLCAPIGERDFDLMINVYNYLVSANLESADEAPINLRSLYAANGGEPEFTNYTPGFTGTLDYIFLSDGSSIKPTSLLRLPRGDAADVQGGLPNFQHPSDHLPIGADFLVVNI
ncbi:hypothetical protein ACP70R_040004 [Stipagrostis hirtigluma subsp. patula]